MHVRAREILDVSGHEREVFDERDGGDLLVERVGWVPDSQRAPDLSGDCVGWPLRPVAPGQTRAIVSAELNAVSSG